MSAISLDSKLGKNLIINPAMDIWQRALTFNPATDGQYLADRFLLSEILATGVLRVDRSTDVPADSIATYSLKVTVVTAQAVVAAGEYAAIIQRIEGYNLRQIKSKSAVLSFKVKSAKAGEHSVSMSNGAQDRSLVKKYTVNQVNTWEKKVIRLKHDSSGTWDYSNGIGLYVQFMLAAGATLATGSEEWQNGLKIGSDGQQNIFDTVSNEFAITEVQLHEGIDEIPFSELLRDFSTEVELCQRYFEKSYSVDTPVGTVSSSGAAHFLLAQQGTGNEARIACFFKTRKRTVPVATPYSPDTGAADRMATDVGDLVSFPAFTGEGSFAAGIGAGHGTTQAFTYHWTADSEL